MTEAATKNGNYEYVLLYSIWINEYDQDWSCIWIQTFSFSTGNGILFWQHFCKICINKTIHLGEVGHYHIPKVITLEILNQNSLIKLIKKTAVK